MTSNETIPLHRKCPVCENNKGSILHSTKFYSSDCDPVGGDYIVVACERCSFCFADTTATQADYDAYYTSRSKYMDVSTSTGGGVSEFDLERLRQLTKQIEVFETNQEKRILDFGCATGGLLRELKVAGFSSLYGVDPSSACIDQILQIPGINGSVGSLFAPPPSIGMFDGIVLSHVFEHVRDIRRALSNVLSLLAKNGWIYIEVPDATRYAQYIRAPFQDFNTEHINHFSSINLVNLLGSEGFTVVDSGEKVIFSAPEMPYPAIYAFARRSGRPKSIVRDERLLALLFDYTRQSHLMLDRIDENLRHSVRDAPTIILWGVGQLTMKLLVETCLKEANIVGFVDGNPVHWGKSIRGSKVQSPSELTDFCSPILVGSIINQESILRDIAQRKLPNPVITLIPQ